MNIFSKLFGRGQSQPAVTNIAAETPISRAIGSRNRVSFPTGGGGMGGGSEPLTEREVAELGFDPSKRPVAAEDGELTPLERELAKRKRQAAAQKKREEEKTQKAIDEAMFGLAQNVKSPWQRYGNHPFTPEMAAAVIVSQRLDTGEPVEKLTKLHAEHVKLAGLLSNHTEEAARQKRKELKRKFMLDYEPGLEYPDESEDAHRRRLLTRRAIKNACRRRSEEACRILRNFVEQLIRAVEREADSLEKAERAAHAQTGGKYGLPFHPSALLIAFRQAHSYRLAGMLPGAGVWHESPRKLAERFGLKIEAK